MQETFMDNVVEQYWGRALKIARQYENAQVAFADLTGLIDEFAAAFFDELNSLTPSARAECSRGLEARLQAAVAETDSQRCREALEEMLVSLNRTPIY